MFTGIVATTGRLEARHSRTEGLRLRLDLGSLASELQLGDSVCVSGVCLTLVALRDCSGDFDISPETLAKTWFSDLSMGDSLNLELSLRVGDRLGGHFVTGHVDGLGRLESSALQGDWTVLTFSAPPAIAPLLVAKGSITVDGVSLTLASLEPPSSFSVALIPETLTRTTMGALQVGDPVHLEGDLLGKFVQRSLQTGPYDPASSTPY